VLRFLANLLWFLLGGVVMGLGWWLAGILAAITIIGIPYAIAAFRIGAFSFWPFGRAIVDRPSSDLGRGIGLIGNVIWAVFLGWWLALGHLISALLCAITIIGIPFAWQHLRLAALSLAPYSKAIVTT